MFRAETLRLYGLSKDQTGRKLEGVYAAWLPLAESWDYHLADTAKLIIPNTNGAELGKHSKLRS